ncbi:gliding motility-associated ABC transporter ATP- binding subunit GldA, gldA [Lactococcus lactis subsp. lactis]|nr:gliding motility-associated ABC transporter ATP- binding subunit GldA, gldA [Lactococcus lactis subsp. lactis]
MSLNIENLYKTYGKKHVLNNISVNFQAGKIYGLLGNNGAGKSTLLNIINNRIF